MSGSPSEARDLRTALVQRSRGAVGPAGSWSRTGQSLALDRPFSRLQPPPDALANLFGLRQAGSRRNGMESIENLRFNHERTAFLPHGFHVGGAARPDPVPTGNGRPSRSRLVAVAGKMLLVSRRARRCGFGNAESSNRSSESGAPTRGSPHDRSSRAPLTSPVEQCCTSDANRHASNRRAGFQQQSARKNDSAQEVLPVPHVHIITMAAASNIPQRTSVGASRGLSQVTLRAVS